MTIAGPGQADEPNTSGNPVTPISTEVPQPVGPESTAPGQGPPKAEQAQVRGLRRLWTRRGLLWTGVLGLAAIVLGDKGRDAITQYTDPIVDRLVQGVNRILGVEVAVARITMSNFEAGMLPADAWAKAARDPTVFEEWRSSREPTGFVSFGREAFIELSVNQAMFLKAVVCKVTSRLSSAGMKPALLGGGGDGDPLHAYLALGNQPKTMYTKSGGKPATSILEPLSRDHMTPTPVAVTVVSWSPEIITADLSLTLQRAQTNELATVLVGSVTVVGIPAPTEESLCWTGSEIVRQSYGESGGVTPFLYDKTQWI